MKSRQRKYLRGLAHKLKPVVYVGQKGITAALASAIHEALDTHELIKVKFVEFKEKDQKAAITAQIAADSGAILAGLIGHTAIFYRPHRDPEQRRIQLPD
ncbi:MAG: YhbY family RNA-binding protein [Desulfosarcinaceae bacterium]|nr:YhbY family RNA-binding protein [Desulfosarcinaceae bacterium]